MGEQKRKLQSVLDRELWRLVSDRATVSIETHGGDRIAAYGGGISGLTEPLQCLIDKHNALVERIYGPASRPGLPPDEGIERRMVFAVGKMPDGVPMVCFGIPSGAWDYMKEGKSHTFDFVKAGFDFRMMAFGAETHADCMALLREAAREAGAGHLRDATSVDFGIKEPRKH